MSISSIGAGSNATATPGSAVPLNGEPATPSGFAALLAGAIAPHFHLAVSKPAIKATSELDQDAQATVPETSSDDGSKDDAASRALTLDAALAALGAGAAGLNAILKAKLARVVSRMHNEFGRDVQLVEGVRSQERQNQLFAQGRDTAGPVVTWTRNSLHSSGRAADLMINGGYDDAAGFALLRQVAEQEGLHTLGTKDPGHLELPGAGTSSARTALNVLSRENLIVATTSMGRVATPAVAASVASVARVATVAQVAQVGVGQISIAPKSAESPATLKADPNVVPGAPSGKGIGGDAPAGGGNSSGASGDKQDGATRRVARLHDRIDGGTDARAGTNAFRAVDSSRGTSSMSDTSAADALSEARASTATHAARVMDAQDAPGPRSISHLTLSLDDGQGGQDQVRVGMRGSSVGASFDMSNAASADRVSSRLGELTRSLAQRGLDPQAFQVRAATSTRDTDVAHVAAFAPDARRAVGDAAATRHDTQSNLGGDARQRFSQQGDQQDRAHRRQEDQRRRASSFSLTNEAS